MRKQLFLVSAVLFPLLLQAHGTHGSGILTGFTHPILGTDHAIVIFGVGFIGYLLNPKKWYLYLLAFLIPMIVGGHIGINMEANVFVEKVIAASVVITGVFVALHKRMLPAIAFIGFAIFGLFHGTAHGVEMPKEMSIGIYIGGFALGTALMTCLGMLVNRLLKSKQESNRYIDFVAGLITGAGLIILLA